MHSCMPMPMPNACRRSFNLDAYKAAILQERQERFSTVFAVCFVPCAAGGPHDLLAAASSTGEIRCDSMMGLRPCTASLAAGRGRAAAAICFTRHAQPCMHPTFQRLVGRWLAEKHGKCTEGLTAAALHLGLTSVLCARRSALCSVCCAVQAVPGPRHAAALAAWPAAGSLMVLMGGARGAGLLLSQGRHRCGTARTRVCTYRMTRHHRPLGR